MSNHFLNLPENLPLKFILDTAKRGIRVTGETKEYIGHLLQEMLISVGRRKILLLLEALIAIAHSDNFTLLSSIGFQTNIRKTENDLILYINFL